MLLVLLRHNERPVTSELSEGPAALEDERGGDGEGGRLRHVGSDGPW